MPSPVLSAVLTSCNLCDSPPKKHCYHLGFTGEKLRHREVKGCREGAKVALESKPGFVFLQSKPILGLLAPEQKGHLWLWFPAERVEDVRGVGAPGLPWGLQQEA